MRSCSGKGADAVAELRDVPRHPLLQHARRAVDRPTVQRTGRPERHLVLQYHSQRPQQEHMALYWKTKTVEMPASGDGRHVRAPVKAAQDKVRSLLLQRQERKSERCSEEHAIHLLPAQIVVLSHRRHCSPTYLQPTARTRKRAARRKETRQKLTSPSRSRRRARCSAAHPHLKRAATT